MYVYSCVYKCEVVNFETYSNVPCTTYWSSQEPKRLSPVPLEMVAGIPEKLMQLPVPKDVFAKCKQ